MHKYRVLITWRTVLEDFKIYEKIFKKNKIKADFKISNQFLSEKQLLNIIHEYDGIICGDDKITNNVIQKANKLKVITKWGTGLDSIDLISAKKMGIKVFNTPAAFTQGVTEMAMGMMLSLSRKICSSDKDLRKAIWSKRQGFLVNKKTVGIFGLGLIGKNLIKRLRGFELDILGNDIKQDVMKNKNLKNIKFVSKNSIFSKADIIFLCVDLNKRSKHLLNLVAFKKMKKNPIIINICRGPVINEKDLYTALKKKMISGAALDVYEKEPIDKKNILLKFENCIFNSHNSYNTIEEVRNVHLNTIKNLLKGLNER